MAATSDGTAAAGSATTDLGGHVFSKKTFGKPTYCHHCCDKIWGMLSQGYLCEGLGWLNNEYPPRNILPLDSLQLCMP